eukprot:9668491-Alexandrium_andersonii.AAC.1
MSALRMPRGSCRGLDPRDWCLSRGQLGGTLTWEQQGIGGAAERPGKRRKLLRAAGRCWKLLGAPWARADPPQSCP